MTPKDAMTERPPLNGNDKGLPVWLIEWPAKDALPVRWHFGSGYVTDPQLARKFRTEKDAADFIEKNSLRKGATPRLAHIFVNIKVQP